jgi:hypothetical protein
MLNFTNSRNVKKSDGVVSFGVVVVTVVDDSGGDGGSFSFAGSEG